MGCANLNEVSYFLFNFQVVSVSVLTAVVVSRLWAHCYPHSFVIEKKSDKIILLNSITHSAPDLV